MIAAIHTDSDARRHPVGMRPSKFDLLTSFFFALIVMLATIVTLLVLIWLLNAATAQPDQPIINATQVSAGTIGIEQADFQVPQAEEIVHWLQPTLPEVIEQVSTISASVALSHPDSNATEGTGDDGKRVGPDGIGDESTDTDMVPPSQRWDLVFSAANRRAYAQQLDFFQIELGVFGGQQPGIDYALNLSTAPLARHNDRPATEQRLYFSWIRPTPLSGYERQLLTQAGIAIEGRQILKFIPGELEKQLTAIELEYAQSRGVSSISAIAKTLFRSEPAGSGYRFQVISQRYRKPR